MPHLNTLLSQYECLLAICRSVSSADIVHLAATCKENRASITASQPTYDRLRRDACCDGKGIVAQARVFGHHGRDLSAIEWECMGPDGRACVGCGAIVCDNCRFHCVYRLDCLKYTMEDYDPIEDEGLELYTDWEGTEREFLDELTYQAVEEGKPDYDHVRYPSVELRKAWDIFNLKRFSGPSSACNDCYEEIAELICGCHCDMFDYFVGSRWLCIPCLLVEETMVYKDIQPKAKKGEAPRLCSCCGEFTANGGTELCKICRRPEHHNF